MKKSLKKWLSFCLATALIVGGISVVQPNCSEVKAAAKEESLMQTLGVESVTAGAGDTRLGAVSSTSSIFTFKMTHPGSAITGGMKLNVFSPGNDHVWQGGYLIGITGKTDNTVDFSIRNGSGEGLLCYPGDAIEVEAGDYMLISAWIEGTVFYVSVNGKTVMQYDNAGGAVTTGVYSGVYNEWSDEAEFVNVPVAVTTEGVESILQTAGVERISAARNADTRLGAVSDTATKFTFELTHPGSTITGQMKINVFSPGNNHVWEGGYLICITAKTEDTVDFSIRNGNGEGLLCYPGAALEVEAGDYMLISAWIEGTVFYVSVNGTTIMQYDNAGGAASIGVYNGVYNEMSTEMEFVNVLDEVQPEVPDESQIPTDVVFEKIAQTVTAPANDYGNLGQISSVDNGFTFKVDVPNSTADLKIGLFNTLERNPWGNGYIFTISPRETAGTFGFALRKGSDETLLSYPGDVADIAGDQLLVHTWIDSGTIYIAVNGQIVLQYQNDGSIEIGTYMSAHNGWSEEAVFTSYIDDSDVEGDCNGDGTTNLKDLMRLKKYIAGNGLVNNQANLVIEGSEGIDILDLDFLRNILMNLGL